MGWALGSEAPSGASCLDSGWGDGVVRVCCAGGDDCVWWNRCGRLTCWGVNVLIGVECCTCVGDDWDVMESCVWAIWVCV